MSEDAVPRRGGRAVSIGVWRVDRHRWARTRALTKSGSDDSCAVYLAQLVLSRFWVGADGATVMPGPLADRVPDHGGRVLVGLLFKGELPRAKPDTQPTLSAL